MWAVKEFICGVAVLVFGVGCFYSLVHLYHGGQCLFRHLTAWWQQWTNDDYDRLLKERNQLSYQLTAANRNTDRAKIKVEWFEVLMKEAFDDARFMEKYADQLENFRKEIDQKANLFQHVDCASSFNDILPQQFKKEPQK